MNAVVLGAVLGVSFSPSQSPSVGEDTLLPPDRHLVAFMLFGRRGELCGVGDSGGMGGRVYPPPAPLRPVGEVAELGGGGGCGGDCSEVMTRDSLVGGCVASVVSVVGGDDVVLGCTDEGVDETGGCL